MMDTDGKNQRQLTNNELINTDPIFTPDGTRIVFVGQSDSSENLGVYVMNLEQPFTKEEIIKRIETRLE
jgi:Tol biopolymer transport system component